MKSAKATLAVSLFLFSGFVSLHEPFVASAHAEEAARLDIGTARDIYDGSLFPDKAVRTYSNTDKIFPTRTIKARGNPSPLPVSDNPIKALSFSSEGKTYDFPDYVALNRMVGLLILKDGKIVFEHYDFGFTPEARWMSMSVAKSLVSTLVGAAIKDGYIASINDPVTKYLPQLSGSAYEGVSVRDMLMMASGVKWNGSGQELQLQHGRNGAHRRGRAGRHQDASRRLPIPEDMDSRRDGIRRLVVARCAGRP